MFNEPKGFNMETMRNQLTALELETRSTLPTAEAAVHLNRSPQTLRYWAMKECGPLRPIRIHKRLAWSVADIKRIIGVHA